MKTVYVETSIVSYAAARPSLVPQIAVRQGEARRWWQESAPRFEVLASEAVLSEAGRGDPEAARKRLELLTDVKFIAITEEMKALAAELLSRSLLPARAAVDALHVAVAAIGGVDYLLTLNCRHIANAYVLPLIYQTLDEFGVHRPLICTPAEFLGVEDAS